MARFLGLGPHYDEISSDKRMYPSDNTSITREIAKRLVSTASGFLEGALTARELDDVIEEWLRYADLSE